MRRANEDSILSQAARGLCVVADGMGGHQNGALASRLITETLERRACGDAPLQERSLRVQQSLRWLNRRFSSELTLPEGGGDERIMGSTVVALLVEQQQLQCLWAGDSRCYLLRGQRLYQLSRDHSYARELQDSGQMTAAEAALHPSARALTRAVGAAPSLKLESLRMKARKGDIFLLSSDGLHEELSTSQLCDALARPTPRLAVQRLFELALQGRARDNISAVVAHFGGEA